MDPRDAPAREFETLRQRLKATPPYVKMQHDDDIIIALKTLCTDQANQGGYFLLTPEVIAQSKI